MEGERHILVVEDDSTFARTLHRSFEKRGYSVTLADGLEAVRERIGMHPLPEFAVVDLKLASGTGLECIRALHAASPASRIVVLTGFASIATAVEAIKLGACHYLPKPSNVNDIIAAFDRHQPIVDIPLTQRTTSVKTIEWERIHETLVESQFNISETARRLGMHRRTLARKLAKWRVK